MLWCCGGDDSQNRLERRAYRGLDAFQDAAKLFPVERRTPVRRRAILIITANDEEPNEKKTGEVTSMLLAAGITANGLVVERYDLRSGSHTLERNEVSRWAAHC